MISMATHFPVTMRVLAEINMEHLRELQRFAEVGRVSAGLIHDISSPLTGRHITFGSGRPRAFTQHQTRQEKHKGIGALYRGRQASALPAR